MANFPPANDGSKAIHIPGYMYNEIRTAIGFMSDDDNVVIDVDPQGYLMVFKNNEWVWDQKYGL
jgi:hypothetical protein